MAGTVHIADRRGNIIEPNLDAFERLRVSYPETIFDCTFEYDAQPLLWSSALTGGGTLTHNSNKASIDLTVGTASGDQVIYQTRRYFKYHPGKSQFVVFTGVAGNPKANVRKRVGQFDANNGFFFEVDGTTAYAVVRSSTSGSPVDTKVAQADWSKDKLDGTGESGVTIDFSKQNILFVDYQWLGSGAIRFGTIVDGRKIYAHIFNFANTLTLPYSRTATLPLRVELTNTGVSASSTTTHLTCATVYSEGGYAPEGILRSVNNDSTAKTTHATNKKPLLALRKASANPNIPVQILSSSLFIATTDDILVEIWINPSLTGATYAKTVGKCEADFAATALSGGTLVYSTFCSSSGNGLSLLSIADIFNSANVILGSNLAGASDVIVVSAQNVGSGGSATILTTLTFREHT